MRNWRGLLFIISGGVVFGASVENSSELGFPQRSGAEKAVVAIRYDLPNLPVNMSPSGGSGLGAAIIARDVAQMRAILTAERIDLNVPVRRGEQWLHAAVYGQKGIEVVQVLLDHGADPKLYDKAGIAPLYYAIQWDDAAAVDLLIRAGADVKKVTRSGFTAMEVAMRYGRSSLAYTLLAHDHEVLQLEMPLGGVIHYAAKRGRPDIVQRLLASGETIERKSRVDGATPLIRAAQAGDDLRVRQLLEFRPNLDAQDNLGWTGLMYAMARDNYSAAVVLLQEGAKATLKASDGQDAYRLACLRGYEKLAASLVADYGVTASPVEFSEVQGAAWRKLSKESRSALALTALALHIEGFTWASLSGDHDENEMATAWLRRRYNVGSNKELELAIAQVESACDTSGKEVQMTAAEFEAYLDSLLDDPVKLVAAKKARRLGQSFTGAMIIDTCVKANMLTIAGYRAGFFGEAVAMRRLSDSFTRARPLISSWDQVVLATREGLVNGSSMEPQRFDAMVKLFMNQADPNNPWASPIW